jgi:HK97 family phage major capsid protein
MNYEAKRAALYAEAEKLINSGDLTGAEAKMKEIEKLDEDHEQEMKARANLAAMQNAPKAVKFENVAVTVPENAKTIGEMKPQELTDAVSEYEWTNSKEYRLAFMNFVVNGTKIPAKFSNSPATTVTGDVGSVIPNTILLPIIQKLENSGRLYALMRKTNIKGGVTVPTSSVRPVATWLAERGDQDSQKKTTGSITFTYYKLKCKVAVSFEVSVVTLDAFEATLINDIYTAMIKVIEIAAISGAGAAEYSPTGVLADAAPTGQTIEIAYNASVTFADVMAAEGALPEEYDGEKAVWCMTKQTFYKNFKGLQDDQKRPISDQIGGIDNKVRPVILGRPVVFVSKDALATYAPTVDEDTVFAFIFNWDFYLLNFNQQIIMKEFTDESTDDQVRKALALVDGKPIDRNSLVTMVKKKQ